MSRLVILFFLLFSFQALTAPKAAKVIILRAKFFLKKPEPNKKTLKRGMSVTEGSQVLTMQRSMVKLLFRDNTSTILGPNSQISVTQSPKKKMGRVGVISLLKGKLRTKVIPNPRPQD